MDKEKIKELIAKGRIDKALDKLIERISLIDDEYARNDFILQSGRLKRILREKNLGIESSENVNTTLNQITHSVLMMVDDLEIEIKDVETRKKRSIKTDDEELLLSEISKIVGQKIVSFPIGNKDSIVHQIELYKINKQNFDTAEKASAKWGELAPPIILHRIKDAEEKIGQVILQLKKLL